ncbi:MAG TPA: NupC/NupG family nucleoside CNT transporter, partial [Erythrobacter sp.]|nr:NupC/NupG family nucleoside CNT transporter [Erythrobacter sp.]
PGGILMAKIIMPDDDSVLARDAAQMSGVDPHGEIVLPKGRISAEGPAALTEGGKAHEVEVAETFEEGHKPANVIEAAAQGTQTGVKLAVAVGAMVMVFVALVALANGILGGIGGWFGYPDVSFQQLLGLVFAPVMYLIGIPWDQAGAAGGLFGTKIVLNEFVAFIELGSMDGSVLSDRSRAIVTFALCGFANFSSIAIQMAVTGGLAPNQRPVIAKLGLRALAAGSLANLMSAALAGLFLPY